MKIIFNLPWPNIAEVADVEKTSQDLDESLIAKAVIQLWGKDRFWCPKYGHGLMYGEVYKLNKNNIAEAQTSTIKITFEE